MLAIKSFEQHLSHSEEPLKKEMDLRGMLHSNLFDFSSPGHETDRVKRKSNAPYPGR